MDFNEFISAPSQENEGTEIDGSFNCQTCNESVDEAMYNVAVKSLKWKCSKGHESFIKDFSLY